MKKIYSKSFVRGFARGFSSPAYVFFYNNHHYDVPQTETVAESWREVGRLLKHATKVEARKVEQATKENQRELAH